MTLPQMLRTGQWCSAAGDDAVAQDSRKDCARAAAVALADDSKGNASYDINGPQALTMIKIVGFVREVTGKPIRVIAQTSEQLSASMATAGVPGFLISLLGAFHFNTKMGTRPWSPMRSRSSRAPRRQCLREPGCA